MVPLLGQTLVFSGIWHSLLIDEGPEKCSTIKFWHEWNSGGLVAELLHKVVQYTVFPRANRSPSLPPNKWSFWPFEGEGLRGNASYRLQVLRPFASSRLINYYSMHLSHAEVGFCNFLWSIFVVTFRSFWLACRQSSQYLGISLQRAVVTLCHLSRQQWRQRLGTVRCRTGRQRLGQWHHLTHGPEAALRAVALREAAVALGVVVLRVTGFIV